MEAINTIRIPEILTSVSGEPITNVADWENFRKNEILNLFETYVYGKKPVEKPKDLSFEVTCSDIVFHGIDAVYKKIDIIFCNFSFPIYLFVPKEPAKPVPAFVNIMHKYQEEQFDLSKNPNLSKESCPEYLPLVDILRRGYAVAVMPTERIAPDCDDASFDRDVEYRKGVFKVFTPDPADRTGESWGAIAAWAWGTSRVMDYLETEKDVDSTKVAVLGHSRAGKTALWSGANDKRFALVVSNCSGCSGAAVSRNKKGEQIENLSKFSWFCANYSNFDYRPEMLPIDQHMLLALIAPRPLYIGSASEDTWADPANELLSCRLATKVYELYGKKGLVLEGEPLLNVPYHTGNIAYHIREGKHSLTRFDWNLIMDFADKRL